MLGPVAEQSAVGIPRARTGRLLRGGTYTARAERERGCGPTQPPTVVHGSLGPATSVLKLRITGCCSGQGMREVCLIRFVSSVTWL